MNQNLIVPVDNKTLDWPRRVANAVNYLLARSAAQDERLTTLEAKAIELEARIEALEP